MDTIKNLLKLPSFLNYEGVSFELNIFVNGTNDVRLCYDILQCAKDSRHFSDIKEHGCWENPFYNNSPIGFLYLYEGIEDEVSFNDAINHCMEFLKKNRFIK